MSQPKSAPAATSQPAVGQPVPPAEPELPEYVTVLERFEPGQPVTLTVRTETGNRLVLNTRNVRRLRIDRDKVPLNLRRSIALQLDTQGLEWLASSGVEEFERSNNGVWMPVKPADSGRPARP